MGANEITWAAFTCLGDAFGEIFFKKSSKIFKIFFMLLCQGYVKDFNMYVIFKSFDIYL